MAWGMKESLGRDTPPSPSDFANQSSPRLRPTGAMTDRGFGGQELVRTGVMGWIGRVEAKSARTEPCPPGVSGEED